MKDQLKKHESKLRFLVVGGANTLIDFGILFLAVSLGVPRLGANFISTSAAFIFSFFVNRSFTFKAEKNFKKQIIPFLVITLTGLWVLQPIVIELIIPLLGFVGDSAALFVAKLIATSLTLVWNFVLYSRFVFRPQPDADRDS